MQARAVLLGALFTATALLPLAPAAPVPCAERMLAEAGWLDGPDLGEPLLVPPPPPLPAPDLHPCTGAIQPGAKMTNGCTMNFIFRDGAARLYLGTAGHCAEGVGSSVGVVGVGGNVATVVYDPCDHPVGPCPFDFALARIAPAYYDRVDPTVCHWGGPSGLNEAPQRGQTTHLYGWGYGYSLTPATRARAGAVLLTTAQNLTYLGFTQGGDSGAPVLTGDGEAAGIHIVSTVSVQSIRIDPSPKTATRVDAAIYRAEQALGEDLQLVTGSAPFNIFGH